MKWCIHHNSETASTNLDAVSGSHGDVFTADYQTAGRGRLDHKWSADRGKNVILSAVLDVAGRAASMMPPEEIATLPLIAGLAVAKAVKGKLKWPNDVYVEDQKVSGILCERHGDNVIVGIGVNIAQTGYHSLGGDRDTMRDNVLENLAFEYERWREHGFAAAYAEITAIDYLKGRQLSVIQTDDDASPITGICGGILPDGSLDVGGQRVYAGETHIQLAGK